MRRHRGRHGLQRAAPVRRVRAAPAPAAVPATAGGGRVEARRQPTARARRSEDGGARRAVGKADATRAGRPRRAPRDRSPRATRPRAAPPRRPRRARPRPGSAAARRAARAARRRRRPARLEGGELAQHLAAHAADRRPLHVGAEGVGRPGAGATAARRGAARGSTSPRRGRASPSGARPRSRGHSSISAVGAHTGTISPSSATSPAAYASSMTKAVRSGVTSSALLRDPQVADREAAGAQHPGRLGAPHRGELVDLGQQLARRATGGGVDERDGPRVQRRAAPARECGAGGPRAARARPRGAASRGRPTPARAGGARGASGPSCDPGCPVGQHAERGTPRHPLEHGAGVGGRLLDGRPQLRRGSAPGRRGRGAARASGAPRPAIDEPSTSGTVRTTCSPSAPRHTQGRGPQVLQVGGDERTSSAPPSRCGELVGRRRRHRRRRGPRAPAGDRGRAPRRRAARWPGCPSGRRGSSGRPATGRARSGRASTRSTSCASVRPRMSSARLRLEVAILPT